MWVWVCVWVGALCVCFQSVTSAMAPGVQMRVASGHLEILQVCAVMLMNLNHYIIPSRNKNRTREVNLTLTLTFVLDTVLCQTLLSPHLSPCTF